MNQCLYSTGGMVVTGENQSTQRTISVSVCPSQIMNGLARDGTRTSAMRGWQLVVWAVALPFEILSDKIHTHRICAWIWTSSQK